MREVYVTYGLRAILLLKFVKPKLLMINVQKLMVFLWSAVIELNWINNSICMEGCVTDVQQPILQSFVQKHFIHLTPKAQRAPWFNQSRMLPEGFLNFYVNRTQRKSMLGCAGKASR